MSDTSNHYIGKNRDVRDEGMERMFDGCMRDLVAFVLALMVCAVITVCCGCSRKVSENVEVHTTEQNDAGMDAVRSTSVDERTSVESDADERLAGCIVRMVNDSLDLSLKVTEYGDDGQPKKVTEATLHRGKKEKGVGALQTDSHSVIAAVSENVVNDSIGVSMSARHTETEDVKRVVERRGWWSLHWRVVLAAVAAVVMVALVVWKRKRWIDIIVLWIRRFF